MNGSEAPETAAFTRALAALKRRGSNLLVVGAHSGVQLDACRRLLGDDDAGIRRRLFVFTDSAIGVADRLGGGEHDPDHATVIRRESRTRSAAAAGGSAEVPPAPIPAATIDEDEELTALADAVVDAIAEFDAAAGGLDPAELRVCVDSLRPLLDDHDDEAVRRFLEPLTDEVRQVRGMGHFHLPVALDDPAVDPIAPLFDAVVETRMTETPEQRWHLRDGDLTSQWLTL